jgi:hypothetical protein
MPVIWGKLDWANAAAESKNTQTSKRIAMRFTSFHVHSYWRLHGRDARVYMII